MGIEGCGRFTRPPEDLVVATPWDGPTAERFASGSELGADPSNQTRLHWRRVDLGPNLERRLERLDPDLLIGFPAEILDRLASENQLEAAEGRSSSWSVVRKSHLGILGRTGEHPSNAMPEISSWRDLAKPEFRGKISLVDPRTDMLTFNLYIHFLSQSWFTSYADLVRMFANARSIGWGEHSALADLDRGGSRFAFGDAASAKRFPYASFLPITGIDWIEGAAVYRGSKRREAAARAMRSFEINEGNGYSSLANLGGSRVRNLVVDLFGATLVDAQSELSLAWDGLLAAGRAERMEAFLVEPPPWPPASIVLLSRSSGPGGGSMLETLVGQLTNRPPAGAGWSSRPQWNQNPSTPRLSRNSPESTKARSALRLNFAAGSERSGPPGLGNVIVGSKGRRPPRLLSTPNTWKRCYLDSGNV